MNELQIFPVWKQYNKKKEKWDKLPAVPKGVDWRDYRPKVGEIEHANNIGIVIPDRVVVFDLDTYKGVTTQDVDKALNANLDWEMAELQRTVTGGMHYGFALPNDVTIRQGDSVLGVSGFDTRASGKGWICTGEGYEDLTLIGITEAIQPDNLPLLPIEACSLLAYGSVVKKDDNELNDLDDIIGAQPIDGLSIDDLRAYLSHVPDEHLNTYQSWLNIGLACHHQTKGGRDGLRLWAEVSKRSEHYDPDEIKSKWPTFGRRGGSNQITFAYVIRLSGGRGSIAPDLLDDLLFKASEIETKEDYNTFKREILAIDQTILTPDLRGMVAAEIMNSFGKGVGLTKSEIKTAITPKKRKPNTVDTEGEVPEWVNNWVYVEIPCEFAHKELGYGIKREAFNAKYDRMPDCMIAERTASTVALTDYNMPTVVDSMFWPGAKRIFEHDGKAMLNTYNNRGVEPCGLIDDDGQDVVDMFMRHLHFLIDGEKERRILLDWLAYVYQNPGKRINWALLLQGAQGVGKTYFISVLQMLMGNLVTNLDPTAINGRFTGWAHGSLVVGVEEIRISGTNRFETLDRMKPFITNDTVQIEEKGRDHRTVPNFTSYFLLTNHKDAIPLTSGDRRYCVIFSRLQTEEQLFEELGGREKAGDYFSHLFSESSRRADALSRWLLDHKISVDFEPRGRAPETDAREKMMNFAVSPEKSAIEDAIAEHECDVINGSILDITWLNHMVNLDGGELPKGRTLAAILLEMGYEQIDGRRVKVGKAHHYVWIRGAMQNSASAKKTCQVFHKAE